MKDGLSLPRKAFVMWEIAALLLTAILEILLALLLERWFFLRLWVLWLLGLVAVITVFWYLPLRYLNTEYKLESHSFWICKGVFWQKTVCIPRNRVSYVNTFSDPLSRLCKLRSIRISAAGGSVWLFFLSEWEARRILYALSPSFEEPS